MGDPIHNFITIQNRAGECIDPVLDPAQDPCKITVDEATTGTTFTLERKGLNFQVASADASKVTKAFPSYSVPARAIADFLLVRGEFVKALGDEKNPSGLMDKIVIEGANNDTKIKAVADWTNVLSNFVALGQLDPKNPKMKELQINAIRKAFYSFADPTLGTTVEKTVKKLSEDARLTPDSRKRLEWLLQIFSAREKFWSLLKPKMDKSAQVSKELKARSTNFFVFLFANHILAENGFNAYLYAPEMKETAKVFNEILSKVDPEYDSSKNFYALIADAMKEMKQFQLKPDYQKDFQNRAEFIQGQYEKTAQQEMVDLLAAQPPQEAFKEYLFIKYGDTPERKAVMEIIVRHMKVKNEGGKESYAFDMAKIDRDLRTWAGAKSGPEYNRSVAAVLHLLKTLFERGGKMEVFSDKKIQSVDTFYESGNFDLLSMNKKSLEDLIVWARSSAKTIDLKIQPDDKPHLGLRKWTMVGELGVGVAGFGVFGGSFAMPKDSQARYYSQGMGLALGASGLCAAGGNLLAHKLDMNGKSWLFDVGGAVLCGVAAGSIYFAATKGPNGGGGPGGGPGQRNPVDGYGP